MGEQAAKCPGDPVPSPAPPWAIQMLSHALCSCEQALQPTQALSKPCLNEHVLLLLLLSLRLMCSGSMILRRKDKEEKSRKTTNAEIELKMQDLPRSCKGRGMCPGPLMWSARLHKAALSSTAKTSIGFSHPPFFLLWFLHEPK